MPNALFRQRRHGIHHHRHVARLFVAQGWRVRALVRRLGRPGLLPVGVEPVPDDPIRTVLMIGRRDGMRWTCRRHVDARWLATHGVASV